MTAGGETREREAFRILTELVGESGPPPIAYPRLSAWLAGRPAVERRRGEVLFADGDAYRGAVFLVAGTVALRKTSARGRALILSVETAGRLFGEPPHFTGEPGYTVSAHVVAPSRIIWLTPAEVDSALEEPPVGREIVANLARKLQYFRHTIFEFTLIDTQRRLYRFLHDLARSAQHRNPPLLPTTVTLPISKLELSQLMGVTPETLSRSFEALEAAGALVRLPGRAIRLRRWAEGDPA
ncbi:MAG TPA: Crp/Fnr family transcriptional regulator [Thermodesulfobacteriota bacterium]